MGSLPMVIFTPVISAAVGAAWAASLPIREVVRRGRIVTEASFWHLLAFAVLGVLLGLAVVTVGVALWGVVSYRLRGDRAWEVRWGLSDTITPAGIRMRRNGVQLVGVANPPVAVAALGYVDAVVRLPSGEYRLMPQHGMGPLGGMRSTDSGWWFPPAGSVHEPIAPGEYEVRWYGTTARRRRFEIARSKHTVETKI